MLNETNKTFAYHKPSTEGLAKVQNLRVFFSQLEDDIMQLCPASRHRSLALTDLETAAMWAIKAVVANDPDSVVQG